jgi:hypothetical protein
MGDNRSSSHETSRGSKRTVSGSTVSELRALPGPIALSRMERSVRTESDQYPKPQISYIGTGPQELYKAHEVTLNVDAESGPEAQ